MSDAVSSVSVLTIAAKNYTYELLDVAQTTGLSNGDIFSYNSTIGKYTNQTKTALGLLATTDYDTDGTLAANSDTKIATQKATKTYADLKLAKASNLSDLANATTARTNLGLAIGTNVQAWDADLDTWAGKTAPSGTVVGTSDTQTLTGKTVQDLKVTVVSKSADYTASSSDSIIVVTASCTITLPTASSNTNRMLWIKYDNSGIGNLTVAAGDNIDGAATKTITTRYSTLGVFCNGTTWFIVSFYLGGAI